MRSPAAVRSLAAVLLLGVLAPSLLPGPARSNRPGDAALTSVSPDSSSLPSDSAAVRLDSLSSGHADESPDSTRAPEGVAPGHSVVLPGEKLTFTVRYGLIRAGTAVMEVVGVKRFQGRTAYHVVSRAESNATFDGIFRVRDRLTSLIDAEHLHSLFFEKHLREGRYKADQQVRFDQGRGVAVYQDGAEVAIEPGTYDVVAAFYRVRAMNLTPGETFYLTSHDNRKNYPLKVRVVGRERVETPAGTFDCLVLEPTPRSGAFFKNEGRLTVWLTDDERRMPVLMRSRLPIGAITVELIEYVRPAVDPGRASNSAGHRP